MTSMHSLAGAYQQQHATPRLQQAVKLLLMSSLEFEQHLRQQLDINPFLEAEEAEFESIDEAAANSETDPDDFDDGPSDAAVPAAGGQSSPCDWLSAGRSLRDHLADQLVGLRVEPQQRLLIDAVVHALDDDGYLRDGRQEIEAALGVAIDPGAWDCAVRMVQSLEPTGVGARDLRECLLLQLADDSDCAEVLLARTLLTEHFDTLAAHDWEALIAASGVGRDALRAAVELIRSLDPRPGGRHAAGDVCAAVPDTRAVRCAGKWTAVLNTGTVPRLRLNEAYASVVRQRRGDCAALADQLREARWTLRNIAQRLQTIEQVAAAIVARQATFFEYGPIGLKPLHLADIARDVGVHESTVSRVTTNKFIATPYGTLELKYFFSRSLPACAKGPSATAIRRLIEETLRDEDRSAPLSDAEIARRLQRQGLKIARRTVTKYRQQMGIAAVEVRRVDHDFACA